MASRLQNILNAFNDHFLEFVSDIQSVFPEDTEILAAKNSFSMIRKANPKLIIKIWQTYAVSKYEKEINAGHISFFINKDYGNDLSNANNSDKIMETIDRLRNPLKLMNPEDQSKSMKYMQNLSKLSTIYNSSE